MAATPQAQAQAQTLPQPGLPSGSGTSTGIAGEQRYQHHRLPYHNAQPPLYHYSTPPQYQDQGYFINPPSFPQSVNPTAQTVLQPRYFPGQNQHLGPPSQPYPFLASPGLDPSASMAALATHYQPPPFDLPTHNAHNDASSHQMANLVSEEGYEDSSTGKGNHDRFYSGGRQRTPVEAARLFEQQYKVCSKPSKEVRASLSERSGLPLRTVQIWFQNRRAKDVLEAKRAVMAEAAAASAAAVAAGLPPPPPPAFPPSRRQVMRVPSAQGQSSEMNSSPSGPHSHHNSVSGSTSTSSGSATPEVTSNILPGLTSSEAGPSSAPPVMAPNSQIAYHPPVSAYGLNTAVYGYAYPSVGAGATAGHGIGGAMGRDAGTGGVDAQDMAARMRRRSSIANGEAANISTIVQRQRGTIGTANAARRGSIPYPPSIHSALLSANAAVHGTSPVSPSQSHRYNGGHAVVGGGVTSSPLSPRGSVSHLAKTALRNNTRRASMPVNGGLLALSQATSIPRSPASTTVSTQAFTPPRTVSGTSLAALPSDGRVTRELPPSTDQSDQAQAEAALLPQLTGSNGDALFNLDPSMHTPTRSFSTVNSSAMYTIPSNGSTDSFGQPIGSFDGLQHSASTDTLGPLPNPTFVFGNAPPLSTPQSTSGGNGMVNYGIDETFLSMQDRSRLNSLASLASIGTYTSEVPTELSSELGGNGAFDYLPVPEVFDMYSRRASAPADLLDGMGMVMLNPMTANPSNTPIRPSPLGQTHSISSDHLRTHAAQQAGNFQFGYDHGTGLGLPLTTNGLALSNSQHSGSTSPADYPQPNQLSQQWNPALSYAPLVSRETSNSTDNVYTPASFFPPLSSTIGNTDGNGNAAMTGVDQSSFNPQDWANLGMGMSNLPLLPSGQIQQMARGGRRVHGYTLPHHNSSDYLASLNYADQVVPEEDEEDKDHINLAFQPDQVDQLVLQS